MKGKRGNNWETFRKYIINLTVHKVAFEGIEDQSVIYNI